MAIGNPISSQNNYRVIRFTATASQTLFTITDGYAINKIAVYRNGVRLSENLDFTASDATTVTLNDPCQLNDEVVFEILDVFKVTQTGDTVGNVTGNLTGDVYAGIVTATIRFDGDLAGSVNGGIVTCTELDVNGNADISGNVTIGGTLTYDDVTNVDSLGIVTAREGVHFGTVSDGTLVSGNSNGIGIGTTNPRAKLDVEGTLNVSGLTTFNSNVKFGNGGTIGPTTFDINTAATMDGLTIQGGLTVNHPIIADFNGGLDVDGHTELDDLNVSGVSTFAKVALGSSVYDSNGGTGTNGQVLSSVPGIGVSWTDQTGGGGGTSDKIEENNTSAEVVDTGSDGHFKVVTDGTEKLRVISDGSVGIGTTTPIAKLDVQGSSEFDALRASGIVTFNGPRIETESHTRFRIGDANAQLYRQSSDLLLDLSGGNDILIKANASGGSSGNISLRTIEGGKVYLTGTGGVGLYHSDATLKLETTYSGVDVTGVVTATKFSGDGSELTGLTGVGAGIDIKDSDSAIGVAGTINFGTNLSVTPVSLGIVTVTASGGASGVATGVQLVQSDTANAFHYLNFTQRLTGDEPIRTDSQLRWQPNSQELNLGSGNITLATITSDIFTSSTTGTDGVTIADDIKSVRHINSTGVVTATSYEVYSATPEILFNDHNGGIQTDFSIKVNQGVFTIEDVTSSETVFKYSALGEGVELYCDNAKKLATTGSGVSVTGIVTANYFYGDGSNLTNITAQSTGIDIKDSDSAIGIAGTINFGTNLSVTPVSLGIVTVTASSVGGASSINDLSDAKTYGAGGKGIGIGSFALYSISNNVRDNTAIGYSALTNCTEGTDNVAVGEDALRGKNGETFIGNENVAVGQLALGNVRGSSQHNVAIGAKALQTLELGEKNVAIGRLAAQALVTSLSAEYNVYIGDAAGLMQSAGKFGVFVGPGAGRTVTTGIKNVLIGRYAGGNLTVGTNNICIGDESSTSAATANNELTLGGPGITSFRIPGLQSGASNGDVLTYNSSTGYISLQAASGGGGSGASEINDLSDGVTNSGGRTVGLGTGALANDDGTTNDNTALGYYALNANTSGDRNTGVGNSALAKCVDGNSNTAVGEYALNSLTTGDDNTAIGYHALHTNQTALRCTALGYFALQYCTGNNNTGLGVYAGDNITNGTNNTCIGFNAEASSATVANEITLGNTDVTKFRIPGIGITFGDNTSLTDGHVLTYSSSTGEVKLAAVSGGAANAAGSDGQVQYNNGGTSLGGASALYYDDTNNRVGIDTTIPAYELQVGNIGVNPDVSAVAISTALFSYHLGIGHTQLSRTSANPENNDHGAILTLGATSSKTAYIIIDANRSASNDWGSVAIGDYRNLANGGPTKNVAIGGKNLHNCTTSGNIGIGDQNLQHLSSTATSNIGIGYQTLNDVTSGSYNIALGHRAGRCSSSTTNVDENIFIGRQAGNYALSSNSNDNIYIGRNAGSGDGTSERNRNIVLGNVLAAKVGNDQFAIGADDGNGDNYWLVGNELYNVGIGTTNPTSKLTVGGSLNVTGVSTLANVVSFTTSGSDDGIIDLVPNGTLFIRGGSVTDGKLRLQAHAGYDNVICDLNRTEIHWAASGGDGGKKLETQGMGVTVTGRTTTNTLDVTGISTFQDDITVATETFVGFGNTSLDRHDAHLKLYQSGLFEIKNENNESNSGSGVIRIQSNTNDIVLTSITNQVKLQSNGVSERLRTENSGVRITGLCTVTGALSKGSGSFRIDHPLVGMSTTHDLVHSFIEGPQADLIYRGSVDLVSGIGTVNIDTAARMTEGTFDALCTNVQCFTSNETDWTAVKGSVSGNILTITAQDSSSTATVGWMVIGERKDQHMLDTHWTDDDGRVIVEPTK